MIRPTYTPDALTEVAAIKKHIERDVKAIAESLARHEDTEKVLKAHVETAYAALAHLGLKRQRFYKRIEFAAILGGLCWAAAGILPGVVDASYATVKFGAIGGLIVLGLVLNSFAFARRHF